MDTLRTLPSDDFKLLKQFEPFAGEMDRVLNALSEAEREPFALALLHGYRTRLRALVEETQQLLEWIVVEPPREATPAAVVIKRIERHPYHEKARRAKHHFKNRAEVAELRRSIEESEAHGIPATSARQELEKVHDRIRQVKEDDHYIFGLASYHKISASAWGELASVYRALEQEALVWMGRECVTPDDRTRIQRLKTRFDQASAPCGSDLNRDDDLNWLLEIAAEPAAPEPAVVPAEKDPDALATLDAIRHYLRKSLSVAAPVSRTTTEDLAAARCRFKADVARVKARLAEAEQDGRHDAEASLAIRRMVARHESEFNRSGFVFGLSNEHRMPPEAWRTLASAYDLLATAIATDLHTTSAAQKAMDAVDALQAALAPAGRDLRYDQDAENLREDVQRLHPNLPGKLPEDAIAPFFSRLADLPASAEGVADLAEEALRAGVRPSHPGLRDPLLEWTEDLEDLDRPALRPLVRELRLELDRRTEAEEAEPDAPQDAAYVAARERVRQATRGRQVLIVGGHCKEPARAALAAELEADVVWPASDEKLTKASDFDAHVGRADVVIKNRFCRRGYHRAVERAQDQGKLTFVIPSGFNPRRIVLTMADQLRS